MLAPKADWKLVANGLQKGSPDADRQNWDLGNFEDMFRKVYAHESLSGCVLWDFETTPKISSYIYNLCAGDFDVIVNERADKPTPMRIFVRNSKKDYVDADMTFRVITEGMDFYRDLFDQVFPFDKYDIIFCPEFRINAMENVGAITFSDHHLVPLNEQDNVKQHFIYHVHLHELAHMWFGDLTTMVWWNDLWLKESFADFCCAISFKERVKSLDPEMFADADECWNDFYSLALEADCKPSTHPISQKIKHTGDAASTFDEISYRKGATWLKVLDNFLGREVLKIAIQKYVRKFSFKNAVLEDMIDCFQDAQHQANPKSSLDLKSWTDSWLKHKGPNVLEVSTILDAEGNCTELGIKQFFHENADQICRAQLVNLCVVVSEKGGEPRYLKEPVTITGEYTKASMVLKGMKVLAAIPNYDNLGYCQVKLDPDTLDFLSKNIQN